MTIKAETKRGRGRPSVAGTEPKKTKRVPVGGFRDKLTVQDKDPNKSYRWILDSDHTGGRILVFMQAGYAFTSAESVVIGETFVFSSADHGAIIRRPGNKQGDFLYLMELPKDLYDQDQASKLLEVDGTEEALYNPSALQGGDYGSIKISK